MSLIPKRELSEERKKQILEDLLNGSPSPAVDSAAGTLYNDVTFEAKALYDGNDKKLLTYDVSLARLTKARYIRHARPAEVFSLLIANLENKLPPQQKAVADDMLKSYGEWLSAAVERAGDKLVVYTDPEGLVWDAASNLYAKQDFKCSSKREFSIPRIASQQWVDLNKFDTDLVEYLYTRKFDQLPQEMREGNGRAQVYLPPDGQIWPVGRGVFYRCNIGCVYISRGASRGVVVGAPKK